MTSTEPPRRRGLFIPIEGLDRAGKGTLVSTLTAHLETTRPGAVVTMRFPDYTTPIGKLILAYLKKEIEMDDHAIHLLFQANRHEKRDEIIKLLEAGITVVCDRYIYSGLAYSVAKGLNATWCAHGDQRSGMPGPDLVLFLNVSPDVAAKRAQYGDDRYEKLDFQTKVRQVYGKLQAMPMMITIDADRTPEEVAREACAHVDELLCRHETLQANPPIRQELGLVFAQNDPLDLGVERMV